MQGEQVPLILVPRYTSYCGAGDYLSAPVDTAGYWSASVAFWRGRLLGTSSPAVKFYAQGSTDAIEWFDLALRTPPDPVWLDPGQDNAVTRGVTLQYRWLRVKVVLSGTDPAVSCWAAGLVIERVESAA